MKTDRTILQIVPAQPGIASVYRDGDHLYRFPVVCWALIEERCPDGDVFRYVMPLEASPLEPLLGLEEPEEGCIRIEFPGFENDWSAVAAEERKAAEK